MITFFAQGTPKGQPRPKAFARKFGQTWSARVYDPHTAEGWKSQIAIAAKPFLPVQPIESALLVELTFVMPRPKGHFTKKGLRPTAPVYHTGRGDLDNMEKAFLDAMTQVGMWKDDGQVCKMCSEKIYATEDRIPGVFAAIKELPNQALVPPEVKP